jgi:uncharacterized protein (DUF488 family)
MEICSIGFASRSAEDFFSTLERAGVKKLIDVRLNNTSQLSGFTKTNDLKFFLSRILGVDYLHELRLAPTQELLDGLRKEKKGWDWYEERFRSLLEERQVHNQLQQSFFTPKSVLLCSEASPTHCHRRIVLEFLYEKWGSVAPIHL